MADIQLDLNIKKLIDALQQNNIEDFKRYINSDIDLNYCGKHSKFKTCLDIACSKQGFSEYVKILLHKNVEVNKINTMHEKAPIHFAAENGDYKTVEILLQCPRLEIDILSKDNTALHLAIKKMNDKTVEKEPYKNIIELLLSKGTNVNIPDRKGRLPIHSAAKMNLWNIVEMLFEKSKETPDIDTYKDTNEETARMVIEKWFPDLLEKYHLKKGQSYIDPFAKLFYHLYGGEIEEDNFIEVLESIQVDLMRISTAHNDKFSLLQLSCEKGLARATEALMRKGVDLNYVCPSDTRRPVFIACENGYYKNLQLLMNNCNVSFDPVNKRKDSLLQTLLKNADKAQGEPNKDYGKCLKILLENPKIDVNYTNLTNNTALHFAARSRNQEAVEALLEKGAYIGIRNKTNKPPLADMSAKTLQSFLDSCLTSRELPNDDGYQLIFDYMFLVPPSIRNKNIMAEDPETSSLGEDINNKTNKKRHVQESCELEIMPLRDNATQQETKVTVNVDNTDRNASDGLNPTPETDPLLYMTYCSELKPLLNHPVITSFLYLKWQRIACLLYINIIFYVFFWLSLNFYILFGYGGTVQKNTFVSISHALTIIGWFILITREVLQLGVSLKSYLVSFENWLELLLITVTGIIAFNYSIEENYKQQLSAIATLLSSAELVLLIGTHPKFSTNIAMLKTVSWNFLKFLFWYCISLIAFAFSFYSLFKSTETSKETGAEEEPDFFLNPGTSIFKTVIMLTGEYDSGSIKFERFPVTSHIIFIIFVFMVPIVLFNLLNGLAVSDTQAIKENAELVGHISRIKLISYFEKIFLGEASSYQNKNNEPNIFTKLRMMCIKPLVQKICLYPNFLPKAKIGVKTNQGSTIIIYDDRQIKKRENESESEISLCCLRRCNHIIMERKIVKAAKTVIAEKENGGTELQNIKEKLTTCETKLEKFEKILEQIHESVKKISQSQ